MGEGKTGKKFTGSPKMGVVALFLLPCYPQNGVRIAVYIPQNGGAKMNQEVSLFHSKLNSYALFSRVSLPLYSTRTNPFSISSRLYRSKLFLEIPVR